MREKCRRFPNASKLVWPHMRASTGMPLNAKEAIEEKEKSIWSEKVVIVVLKKERAAITGTRAASRATCTFGYVHITPLKNTFKTSKKN